MALTYKSLGQSNPSAATATTLYTVPGSTQTILSAGGVTVCNRSSTPTTFRVNIDPGGGGDSNEQYYAYDVPIGGNQTVVCPGTPGLSLGPGDLIRVYATLATLSFNASGLEIS